MIHFEIYAWRGEILTANKIRDTTKNKKYFSESRAEWAEISQVIVTIFLKCRKRYRQNRGRISRGQFLLNTMIVEMITALMIIVKFKQRA